MRTQVGILGAGPAGLLLSHLLHLQGIQSVIIEIRSRDYIEKRVRAGVLEQATVDILNTSGVGFRMQREGLSHHGIEFRFDGQAHRFDFDKLTDGKGVTVYGQQEVVKDLVARRLEDNGVILFESEDVSIDELVSGVPKIRFRHNGENVVLECDMIAGCDGFHGVSRQSMPKDVLRIYERVYPFGWLGILAEASPSSEELIYANHERGFALHSMRSKELSRNYIQCKPDEDIDEWPDDRIWTELKTRLETVENWSLKDGPILEKSVTPMRGFVAEPMQYGNLYLAGDAAHIVPPTGAKGMNLAVADVRVLADAMTDYYRTGNREKLAGYSNRCLVRVWRTQHFSWWMTTMLHRFDDHDDYQRKIQLSELHYVCTSAAGAATVAENYVGLRWF